MLQKPVTKSRKTPRYRINIDKNLCSDPITCGLKCIEACPFRILGYYQTKTPKKGEAPKNFKIISAFRIMCNNCGKCKEICPQNAITIKL